MKIVEESDSKKEKKERRDHLQKLVSFIVTVK